MSKGTETRERIIAQAARVASRDGLEGVSIGNLAGALGLSKSGLFAHFGSKEALQVEVLRATAARFEAEVIVPALKAPRGEARVRALQESWMAYFLGPAAENGCLFMQTSVELDDKPGPARDFLVNMERQFLGVLAKAARIAVDEGHFRADLDVKLFAFLWQGLMQSWRHSRRLMRDPAGDAMLAAGFQQLLESARSPRYRPLAASAPGASSGPGGQTVPDDPGDSGSRSGSRENNPLKWERPPRR